MMFVVLFFWTPSDQTTFNSADYIRELQSESVQDGTVYTEIQESFDHNQESQEVPLPIGWAFLINFTKGSINQIKAWSDFQPKMTTMLQTFSSVQIKDEELREEIDTFFTSCYLPVQNRYRSESKTPVPTPDADDDLTYIGNQLFLSTPGYYRACTQVQLNAGQCYGAAERMPYHTADRLGIFTGYANDIEKTIYPPTCYAWWTGKDYRGGKLEDFGPTGLRERILLYTKSSDGSPASLSDQQVEMIWGWLGSVSEIAADIEAEKQTALIKRMLKNSPPNFVYIKEKHYGNEPIEQSWMNQGVDYIQKGVGSVKAAWESTLASILVETVVPALPMIQSILIFVVITMSALILPLGLYSVQTVVAIFFVIFTILSWSYWWLLADMINEGLLNWMYPNSVALAEFSLDAIQQRSVITMVTATTYLLFPMLWTVLLGILGIQTVDDVTKSMNKIAKLK
jgi:hypothetical protein